MDEEKIIEIMLPDITPEERELLARWQDERREADRRFEEFRQYIVARAERIAAELGREHGIDLTWDTDQT